jgi:hypothetical protein
VGRPCCPVPFLIDIIARTVWKVAIIVTVFDSRSHPCLPIFFVAASTVGLEVPLLEVDNVASEFSKQLFMDLL